MAERQPSKLHVASSNLVSRSIPRPGDRAASRAAINDAALQLRRALATTLRAGPGLSAAADALSSGYRSGVTPGPILDTATASAYAAARMPATFAATARSFDAVADRLPGFRPSSLLDVGAGTGASAWAAAAVWPGLTRLTLADRAPAMLDLGRRLASGHPVVGGATWTVAAIAEANAQTALSSAELVSASYVLGELGSPDHRAAVVERLWAATLGVLVLVEPGSPAGFERIRAARASLIEAGGRVVAPCPGDAPCPIAGAAWCHFLVRLDRSPLHRSTKGGSRSWEDEPYSYVAVARPGIAGEAAPRVVLGRPRQRPGVVELRVCVDGRIETRTLSRRDGPAWRRARDLEWGDPMPEEDVGRTPE